MSVNIILKFLSIFTVIQNVFSSDSSNYDQSSYGNDICTPSETTASGPYAPKGPFCSGELIFEEEFNDFDLNLWHHAITLNGGYVSIMSNYNVFVLKIISLTC